MRLLFLSLSSMCGYFSRAATNRGVASIRTPVNMVSKCNRLKDHSFDLRLLILVYMSAYLGYKLQMFVYIEAATLTLWCMGIYLVGVGTCPVHYTVCLFACCQLATLILLLLLIRPALIIKLFPVPRWHAILAPASSLILGSFIGHTL